MFCYKFKNCLKKIAEFTFVSFIISLLNFNLIFYHSDIYANTTPLIKKIKAGDPLPADIFIKMAKIINPAVVNISTTQLARTTNFSHFNDPFLDFFFIPPSMPIKKKPLLHSLGTGFIVQSDGFILTNTHVINKADTIQVQLKNNQSYMATIIGQDTYTDIALLKINASQKLPTAKLGNSSQLQVGEWVSAFGNPYGHGHTMTKGIISAINRQIDELNLFPFLQTDAIINPGNSGGPLVNTKGEVIGINTAMRTQGISFAIPIDNVKVILKDLKQFGRVRRGFIGVQIMTQQNSNIKGAVILVVMKNTPAEKSGIKIQDIIVSFNKIKVQNYTDLFKAVASSPVNKVVPITLIRNQKKINLDIIVAERIKKTAVKHSIPKPLVKNYKKNLLHFGMTVIIGNTKIMQSMNLPPLNRHHPIITKVNMGFPAARARLKKKDIILKVNGWQVLTIQEIYNRLSKYRSNTLNILRYRPKSREYINMIIQLRAH